MAGKPGRGWFPVENGFIADERILEAGELSGWLFLGMLGYISEHRSRGVISRAAVTSLGLPRTPRRLDSLIGAGLVEDTANGVLWVPAWEDWNTPSDHAAYMRAWRAKRQTLKGAAE